jgi:hypothetical protein
MNEICSRFIGKFKVGDNINYNLASLAALYEAYHGYNEAQPLKRIALQKPMIFTVVSIIEALLYDVHFRITNHTIEGVGNVDDAVMEIIRDKPVADRLYEYIESARKHTLIGPNNDRLYERLHEMRELRNRIHIANHKGLKPDDEKFAFTSEKVREAEKLLEFVMRHFERHYLRDDGKHYVANFKLPWDPHYPNLVSDEEVRRKTIPRGWFGIARRQAQ